MKNSKFTSKKIYIICAIAIFLILLVIFATAAKSNKTTVCFYGLPEQTVKSIQKEIKSIKTNENKAVKFDFIILDSNKNILTQIPKKASLLITQNGKPAQDVINNLGEKKINKINISSSIMRDYTISMQQASSITEKNKVSLLPVLCDNVEIDLCKKQNRKFNSQEIRTFAQFEQYMESCKNDYAQPISFAGNDSAMFLNIITALTETFEGKDAVYRAEKIILSAKNNSWDFNELVNAENAPLYKACETISRWKKSGLIKTEAFGQNSKTVVNLMEQKQAGAVFTTLSEKRLITQMKILSSYETIPEANEQNTPFIPSTLNLINRSCVSPIICAVPLSSKNTETIFYELASEKMQEKLSRATGLAPAHRQSRVPDSQADDVRFWIATTNEPLTPLGLSCFSTDSERNAFTAKLLEIINNM